MGNSPSSSSTSTDDEEKPTVHPEQTTFDENAGETETADEDDDISTAGAVAGGVAAGVSPTFPENETPEGEEAEPRDESLPEGEPSEEESGEQETDDIEDGDVDEDDSEEEEEAQEAVLFVYTDPWDTTGWANEPELRDLEVTYPESLSVSYKPLPPRAVDQVDRDHSMPVSSDVDTPENTETSFRALRAADEQDRLRAFLRRARIAGLSEGRNIEDEQVLLELADEVGLDTERFKTHMEQAEIPDEADSTPRIEGLVGDEPHRWVGRIEAKRLKVRFTGEQVEPDPTSIPQSTLAERHEPVATPELQSAYGDIPSGNETIQPVKFGGDKYWVSA